MRKLLIIEDDEQIRELVESILEDDYHLRMVSSLDQAEAFWSENRSEISVILSDLCLPDATSTVSRINSWQSQSPGLAVVFVSGLSPSAVEAEFGLVNGVDFLSKPFSVTQLRQIVLQAVRRSERQQDVTCST